MDTTDDLAAIREDVERAVELYVQLSYFTLGSTAGELDAGHARHVGVRQHRTRRVFRGEYGQRLASVLPGGTVEQGVSRTGRAGGFASPESDRDVMLWKSTIGRKLGRLDEPERRALEHAAKLRVAIRELRGVVSRTDALLGSPAARKRLTPNDVRLMQTETDDIVRILGRAADREWSGTTIDRIRKEQGYRRRIIEACTGRRRSIVNSQMYANSAMIFAIVCRAAYSYCLAWSPD